MLDFHVLKKIDICIILKMLIGVADPQGVKYLHLANSGS